MRFGDCSICLQYKNLNKGGFCRDCSYEISINRVTAYATLNRNPDNKKLKDLTENFKPYSPTIRLNEFATNNLMPSILDNKLIIREDSVDKIKPKQKEIVQCLNNRLDQPVKVTKFEIRNIVGKCNLADGVSTADEDKLRTLFDDKQTDFNRTSVEPGKRTVRYKKTGASYTIKDSSIKFSGGTDIEEIKTTVGILYQLLYRNQLLNF